MSCLNYNALIRSLKKFHWLTKEEEASKTSSEEQTRFEGRKCLESSCLVIIILNYRRSEGRLLEERKVGNSLSSLAAWRFNKEEQKGIAELHVLEALLEGKGKDLQSDLAVSCLSLGLPFAAGKSKS